VKFRPITIKSRQKRVRGDAGGIRWRVVPAPEGWWVGHEA